MDMKTKTAKIIEGHKFYYFTFGKTKVDAKRKAKNLYANWYVRILSSLSGWEVWRRLKKEGKW